MPRIRRIERVVREGSDSVALRVEPLDFALIPAAIQSGSLPSNSWRPARTATPGWATKYDSRRALTYASHAADAAGAAVDAEGGLVALLTGGQQKDQCLYGQAVPVRQHGFCRLHESSLIGVRHCCAVLLARSDPDSIVGAMSMPPKITPDPQRDARAGHRIMKSGWTACGSRDPSAFGL